MLKRSIPFYSPSVGKEEIEKVTAAIESGWLTTGPYTKEFENKFAEYVGAEYAVAVNSCTAGLHLALLANNVGQSDEVITTPYTFAATAEVIIHTGANIRLVDVKEGEYNIDPMGIKYAITPRTKVIMPVHFAGEPCDMAPIMKIAEEHDIKVIEDGAHALGAKYKGINIGVIGDVTAFSFYATKNLTTGEGGMITTKDKNLAKKIRLLSLHGLSHDAWKRYTKNGKWYYEILEPGYKYNMADIQAAIGLAQLEKFEFMQKKRNYIAQFYIEALKDIEEITLPKVSPYIKHAWHLFVIRINTKVLSVSKNDIINLLEQKGIGTSVHFIPLHLHPYYRLTYNYKNGDFPNAEDAFRSSISLPFYPDLTLDDVAYIAKTLQEIISKNTKKKSVYFYEGVN